MAQTKQAVAHRFARLIQDEPVFVENGLKGIFALMLGFGWLQLSPQVTGQLLFVASFALGLYARLSVTPLSRPKGRSGDELVPQAGMIPTQVAVSN